MTDAIEPAPPIPALDKRATWGKDILDTVQKHGDTPVSSGGAEAAPFLNSMRYIAWQMSGDKKYLEDLYADEIQTDSQRMYMVTDGQWWIDRVELFSDLLQRSRMGGMTLRRNQMYQGNLVSWRFGAPTEA